MCARGAARRRQHCSGLRAHYTAHSRTQPTDLRVPSSVRAQCAYEPVRVREGRAKVSGHGEPRLGCGRTADARTRVRPDRSPTQLKVRRGPGAWGQPGWPQAQVGAVSKVRAGRGGRDPRAADAEAGLWRLEAQPASQTEPAAACAGRRLRCSGLPGSPPCLGPKPSSTSFRPWGPGFDDQQARGIKDLSPLGPGRAGSPLPPLLALAPRLAATARPETYILHWHSGTHKMRERPSAF